MNGNVAYLIWNKQEKVSFDTLSYVKEDLSEDDTSDRNRRCNSRVKKFCFIFPIFFPSFSIISLGPNSDICLGLYREA